MMSTVELALAVFLIVMNVIGFTMEVIIFYAIIRNLRGPK